MQRFLSDRRRAGQDRARVFQVGGGIGGAAVLATVAVLVRRAAARTFAFDETVRQEHLLFRVEGLGDDPAADVPGFVQPLIDQFGVMTAFR